MAIAASLLPQSIHQKYAEERKKRLREDGTAQYVPLTTDGFQYLLNDPWVDHKNLNAQHPAIQDGDECKILILGAGYGGLLFAVRLIQAGFSSADIRLVDTAGGYGGTWYWNRYPGLMCDIESYIYMPLLEETGYIPKHKYAYGPELRAQAERIADTWDLRTKTLFRTRMLRQVWNEATARWDVTLRENRGSSEQTLHITARFVILAGGPINIPQIPKLAGFENFGGKHFHTARWDYAVTGGSPEDPSLEKLRDKTVAIIGTGATAVQVVPAVAKYAKRLYVFQRTPASVDVRGQHETDVSTWASKVATGPGWQRARAENFNSYISGIPDGEDLVDDAWTKQAAYKGLMGAPGIVTPEAVEQHIATLRALDLPRAERVRARVDEIVREVATAEKLKAWYDVWCKRPTFHDEYLQAFNRPNVTLVDTDGRGLDGATEKGLVFDGVEYPVDVLVLSTGYRSGGSVSPGSNAGVEVIGQNGLRLDDKWDANGPLTLHGMATNGLPNCFFFSHFQTGLAPNIVYMIDTVAQHVAYILTQAAKASGSDDFIVQPSKEAEEEWADEVVKRAAWFSVMLGCTPSALNGEGESAREKSPIEALKAARKATWAEGIADYVKRLEAWKNNGTMKGLEVKRVAN